MKLLKKLVLVLILFILVACESHPFGKYISNGQYIEITYDEYDEMIQKNESFVYYLKKKDCSYCKRFEPVLKDFLDENRELKIYALQYESVHSLNTLVLSSHYSLVLGKDYYDDNGYDRNSVYTPTFVKILNGTYVEVEIGLIDKIRLNEFYHDNFFHLDYYYDYNLRVTKGETFDIFISNEYDVEYDSLLRNYYLSNPNLKGYYLDKSNFKEDNSNKLLNRINSFLGEENAIEELPEYIMLRYQSGILTVYDDQKYDVEMLNSLYLK